MAIRVIVRPKAKREVRQAKEFLEDQREGLGSEFKEEFASLCQRIQKQPTSFKIVDDDVRRAVMDRFKYNVYFVADDETVTILVVAHQHRDPSYWAQRVAEEKE